MSCNNCFTGCAETTSDQCVKYTGLPIEWLGIETGDSLASVEDAIFTYLQTVVDGIGILPDFDVRATACAPILSYLPPVGIITLNDILEAILKGACDSQEQINTLLGFTETLEGNYTIGDCLTGVSEDSGTHLILQSVINQLCALTDDLATLEGSLTAYVLISDLNSYIQAYLEDTTSTKMYTKMVPYVAVEYYGETSDYPSTGDSFDINGVGTGAWEKVYLCNGYGGKTPDKRGWIPIGATTMGNGVYADSRVDPASGNPTYAVNTLGGSNTVTLNFSQIPSHTHTLTSNGEHHHTVTANNLDSAGSGFLTGGKYDVVNDGTVDSSTEAAHTHVVGNFGGGTAHSNIPPVRGCLYIMYVPS